MEDTELEDVEALSYQNDGESNIDLDALTYIDEKLQNVLGHLKKDFEGGVTSEYLGTKYGGYGSFLTQPSPAWSYSRSPANVQDSHSHKSVTCLSAECGSYSSLSRPNGNHSIKHGSGSVRSASSDLYKAPSEHFSLRQTARTPFKHSTEESTEKVEAVDKSTSMNEQKTFKVRIKVVSDNLSAKKSTSIYSGLGLVSPSSSFGDSPTGSEGLYQRFQFPGDESPTQIIRMMTSFPRSHLLSPLPEGLVRLTEKLLQGHKAQPVFRHRQDNSVLSSNLKTDKTLPVEDTLKPEETDQLSPKDKEDSVKALDDFHVIMSHQTDLNNEACEVLISEALKLPLLFDLHGPSQGKRGTSKQKSNLLPTVVSGETVIPILRCDSNWNEKQIDNKNLAVEVANEKKVDLQTDFRSYTKKDGDSRGEAGSSSSKTNENDFVSKSKEDSNSRPSSSQKQKNSRKYANVEQVGKKLISGSEQLPSSGKKKHKRSHFVGTEATEIQNESIRNAVSGNKASCTVTGAFPKLEGIIKAKDKDEYLLGNLIEEGHDLMDSPDEPSNDRLNTSQICNQCLLPCDNDSRKRSDNGAHEHLISKVNSKRALDFAAPSGLVPPIGDPASAGAPVEDWVQCDKCLKWRLLPFATKVDSLPEKWLCGMLNWLPGMNSCNITEEETTKAAAELYQPQNRNGLHGSLAVVIPGVTASSDLHLTQTRRDTFPGSGKKHHHLKEVPDSKQESLHSVGSEMENELHFRHSRKYTDPVLDTNQRKKKSKKNKRDGYFDGGRSKDTRLGGKREPYQDSARAKRVKTKDVDWMCTHDVGNEMPMHNSSNKLLSNGAQNTNHTSSSQSSKDHTDDRMHNSIKKSNFQVQASSHAGCLDASNAHDRNDDTQKRKVKSSIDVVNTSILSDDVVNESLQTGQKRVRMPLLEEKASSSSQGNGKIEKRRKSSKDHPLRKDVESTLIMDDKRSLKRKLSPGANSGFSKVIDSQKSNSIVHEVKSSPVELISSFPFGGANPDIFAAGKKNQPYKDCSHVDGILTKDDSKRFADIEDNSGGQKSGVMRKNICGNNDHHSVHGLKDQTNGCLVDDKVQIKHSLDPSCHSIAVSQVDTFDQHKLCTSGAPFDDGALDQPAISVCNDIGNGSHSKQSAKVSSWSKDKRQVLKSELYKTRIKVSKSYGGSRDHSHTLKDKTRDNKVKFREKSECSAGEMDYGGKKKPSGIMLGNATKENGKLKSVDKEDSTVKADSTCDHESRSDAQKQVNTDCGEKKSKLVDQVKNEEISSKEKSGKKGYMSNHVLLPGQDTGAEASYARFQDRGKGLKEHNSPKKSDIQNGAHSLTSKHQLSIAHRLKDRDTPSPMRRDSHNQAASNALKEAKDMKHLADRMKNSGSTESTGLYFEAVLKFLHGACLLESSGSENSKRGDIIQSMQVYSSTAKLCEFCAHEYEKSRDLASASLAYKCMEVAYLRVIYSSHPAASRDRHEFQTSLQMVPPGESPSSSASDIDNASNPAAAAEKAAQAKDGNSPHPAGNHIIAAKSRSIFSRLMNFMQDVNFAMEASRKSQGAFAAFKATTKQADSKEGISSLKRVLDYNFHDVNGLLQLVHLAMEAIKHH